MDHRIHPSARGSGLRLIASVLGAAVVLAGAPAALAGPATDEYKLELPEVERAGLESTEAAEAHEPAGAQDGVVAEDVPTEGTLEAAGSTLLAAPVLIAALLGIGLLAVAAITTRSRGARP